MKFAQTLSLAFYKLNISETRIAKGEEPWKMRVYGCICSLYICNDPEYIFVGCIHSFLEDPCLCLAKSFPTEEWPLQTPSW